MASRIVVTLAIREVREPTRDDVRVRVRTGERNAYLSWWPIPPSVYRDAGMRPHTKKAVIDLSPLQPQESRLKLVR